jgi:GntR family transcriptional regulator
MAEASKAPVAPLSDRAGAAVEEAVAPLEQLDNRLLAGRARAEILKAIFDGRFKDKLPSEDKLAVMLNVSRTTVRTALQGLERDGVVSRQRAIGTLINPHARPSSLALQRLAGFDGLLRERGYEVEVEISLSREWRNPPAEVADAFPLQVDHECCLIEKAYSADGTLALSVLDAIPREEFAVDELPSQIDASLFTFSEQALVAPIHHAVVELIPRVKDGQNTRLEIEDGMPFLRLHEIHYSARGKAIAFSMVDVDDRYIELEVVRTH